MLDPREAVRQVMRRQPVLAVDDDLADEEPIGELAVAEYIIFTLALEVYMSYVQEAAEAAAAEGEEVDYPDDPVIRKGIRVMRVAESEMDRIKGFLSDNLPEQNKRLLDRATRVRATTSRGAGLRAMRLRTVINRGGPKTMRAVFQKQRALRQVREAMAAQMMEDRDAALDKLAAIPMQNARIRAWIDLAAATAGSGDLPQNPVEKAATGASDTASQLMQATVQEVGASTASEASEAKTAQSEQIAAVERQATEAAAKAMETTGEPDVPLVKSEVIGVATAAAIAASSDPSDPSNVPETLRKLDDEQRAAALTDGRVLVAAGAGAGKSTTLVARIGYLVKDRRVDPSRIMACSFNKAAADELGSRIGDALGAADAKRMNVGTLNALFARAINKYGSPAEKQAMNNPLGPADVGKEVTKAVQKLWRECLDPETNPKPKAGDMKLMMTQWAGNNITPEDAKAIALTKKEAKAALWYEMYEGLKGAIPGWKPPCEDRAKAVAEEEYDENLRKWRGRGGRGNPPKKYGTTYEQFMTKARTVGGQTIRIGDFTDQIRIFRDILRRDPGVRKQVQAQFDHIMVDECVHGDTEVMTSDGLIKVKDLCDLPTKPCIQSYENGDACFKQVIGTVRSSKTQGVTVRMASGRELCMTYNHRVYASDLGEVPEGQLALYLMFRRGMGFRVGVSSNPTRRHGSNGTRANAERADALWVLEIGEASEMLFKEQAISLRHRVPTYIFEGTVRGCDQERINRIFAEFGENGLELLKAYNLHFDYPHWTNKTYTGGDHQRHVLTVRAHRKGTSYSGTVGTSVGTSWTGESPLEKYGHVYEVRGGRKMLNKRLSNYVELRDFTLKIANAEGLRVVETLSVGDTICTLTTAGALFEGMSLPVLVEGELVMDEVVEVTPIDQAIFFDIAVQDTANFFGNGVLSHNCQDLNEQQHEVIELMTEHIGDGSDGKSLWMVGDDKQSIYGFRGARPDKFVGMHGQEGVKTRTIRTNYRCEPEIVEAGNRLISHNEGQIPMEARANPARTRGQGSIEVEQPEDQQSAAIFALSMVKRNVDNGAKAGDNAVLARTNTELNAYEAACLINGLKYVKRGASSFLDSFDVKGVMGYVEMMVSEDVKTKQEAFANIINSPKRFWGSNPEQSVKNAKAALREYSKSQRIPMDAVDPMEAMRDPAFVDIVMAQFGKRDRFTRERVEGLASFFDEQQALSAMPGYETKDLFDSVLLLKGVGMEKDPNTGKTVFIEQSMRENLQSFMKDISGGVDESADEAEGAGEEDEVDENQGLGNIGFLYQLAAMEPDDPEAEAPNTPAGFLAKMDQLRGQADDLRVSAKDWSTMSDKKKGDYVYLGTAHSVKGLEWPNVVVSMPANKFPLGEWSEDEEEYGGLETGDFQPRRLEELTPEQLGMRERLLQEHMEQERRLGYVALTRASKNLTVLCPKRMPGKRGLQGVSQFVLEAGLTPGQNVNPDEAPTEAPDAEGAPKTARWVERAETLARGGVAPWNPNDFEGN